MTQFLVTAIVAHGVGGQEPLHAGDEIRLGRLNNQVEVIVHEAIGMNLPVRFLTGLLVRVSKNLTRS